VFNASTTESGRVTHDGKFVLTDSVLVCPLNNCGAANAAAQTQTNIHPTRHLTDNTSEFSRFIAGRLSRLRRHAPVFLSRW